MICFEILRSLRVFTRTRGPCGSIHHRLARARACNGSPPPEDSHWPHSPQQLDTPNRGLRRWVKFGKGWRVGTSLPMHTTSTVTRGLGASQWSGIQVYELSRTRPELALPTGLPYPRCVYNRGFVSPFNMIPRVCHLEGFTIKTEYHALSITLGSIDFNLPVSIQEHIQIQRSTKIRL